MDFWDHVEDVHDMTKALYRRDKGDPMVFIQRIECFLCHIKIKHDPSYLKRHYLEKHGEDRLEKIYFRHLYKKLQNLNPNPEPIDERRDPGLNSEPAEDRVQTAEIIEIDEFSQETSLLEDETFMRLLEHAIVRLEYDKCLFKCRICEDIFHSQLKLIAHLDRVHGMTAWEHYGRFGDNGLIAEDTIKCEICGHEFLRDGLRFQLHLYRGHDISLLQYHQLKTGDKNFGHAVLFKCFYCGDDDFVTASRSSFCEHLQTGHGVTVEHFAGKFKHRLTGAEPHYARKLAPCICCGKVEDKMDISEHIAAHHDRLTMNIYLELCWIKLKYPDADLISAEMNIKADMQKVKETKKVFTEDVVPEYFNGCDFKCNVCPKEQVFYSKSTFKKHIIGAHKLSYLEYTIKNGSGVTFKATFVCMECKQELMHDKEDLDKHFKGVHKLTIVAYYRKYKGDCDLAADEILHRRGHLANSVSAKRRVKCPHCDLEFSKKYLWKHKRVKHAEMFTKNANDTLSRVQIDVSNPTSDESISIHEESNSMPTNVSMETGSTAIILTSNDSTQASQSIAPMEFRENNIADESGIPLKKRKLRDSVDSEDSSNALLTPQAGTIPRFKISFKNKYGIESNDGGEKRKKKKKKKKKNKKKEKESKDEKKPIENSNSRLAESIQKVSNNAKIRKSDGGSLFAANKLKYWKNKHKFKSGNSSPRKNVHVPRSSENW